PNFIGKKNIATTVELSFVTIVYIKQRLFCLTCLALAILKLKYFALRFFQKIALLLLNAYLNFECVKDLEL
ncbi:MAG: hypothetical protein C0412_14340, partial [Flavobacterium sp.]|nr:hypothetical protein [Flavobacterium sp.]